MGSEATFLAEDIENYDAGHANLHNLTNDQVNWLTQQLAPGGRLADTALLAEFIPQTVTQPALETAKRALTLESAVAGHPTFNIGEIDNTKFATTAAPGVFIPDPGVLLGGWNMHADGSVENPLYPQLGTKYEAQYVIPSGTYTMELYDQWASRVALGLANRQRFTTIDSETGYTQILNQGNLWSVLKPDYANSANNALGLQWQPGRFTIYGDASGSLFQIKALAGQQAQVQMGYNGVDNVYSFGSGGSAHAFALTVGVGGQQQFWTDNPAGVTAPARGIGTSTPGAHDHVKVTNVNLTARMTDQIAGGAGSLELWRDSAAVVWHKINKVGYSVTRKTVPVLGDLIDGDHTFYSDAAGGIGHASRVAGVLKTRVIPIDVPTGTPAAATDLATALTLVNSLRTNLLAQALVA